MSVRSLLYAKEYRINEHIGVCIPTVGEILADEDRYYNLVSAFTASPIDMMVQLDAAGVDFTEISDFELFIILFQSLRTEDVSLILGEIDLSRFEPTKNKQNGLWVLEDSGSGAVIDPLIHANIAAVLRKIHNLKKNTRKPGNKEAKEYMIERERKKLERRKNKERDSELESLIIAMVNTEQYKYDFETTKELSIYQFNESVRQIIKKVEYDNRMYGLYSGTISSKDMSQDDLNWLIHK